MKTSEEFVPIGKVSGAYGVKGWMKIFSFTEPRNNILNYSPLYMSRKGRWVEINVSGGRLQGKGVVIGLVNITDRDQVLPLIGSEFAIKKSQMKPMQEEDYYWSDLIGLTVINLNDETLGHVDSLLETGANDVLVVHDKATKEETISSICFE